jgi:hypothetical protein
MACGEKICVICAICETLYSCEKTISSREIIRRRSVREIALREFFSELFGSLKNTTYLCSMVEQEMKREMGNSKNKKR